MRRSSRLQAETRIKKNSIGPSSPPSFLPISEEQPLCPLYKDFLDLRARMQTLSTIGKQNFNQNCIDFQKSERQGHDSSCEEMFEGNALEKDENGKGYSLEDILCL